MADQADTELTLGEAMEGLPKDFAFFGERFDIGHPAQTARARGRPRPRGKEADGLHLLRRARRHRARRAGGFIFFQEFFGVILGGVAGIRPLCLGQHRHQPARARRPSSCWSSRSPPSSACSSSSPRPPPEAIHASARSASSRRWDRAKYEDQLTGARGDAPFEFFEAHLEEKRTTTDSKGRTRTTWVTVFKGQCLAVKFHKEFNGVTKVYRDMGAFNWLAKFGVEGAARPPRRPGLREGLRGLWLRPDRSALPPDAGLHGASRSASNAPSRASSCAAPSPAARCCWRWPARTCSSPGRCAGGWTI